MDIRWTASKILIARSSKWKRNRMATVFIFPTSKWLGWIMILNHYRVRPAFWYLNFFQAAIIKAEWFANFAPASFLSGVWTSFLSLSFTMFLLLRNDKLREYCDSLSCCNLPPLQRWRALRFQRTSMTQW